MVRMLLYLSSCAPRAKLNERPSPKRICVCARWFWLQVRLLANASARMSSTWEGDYLPRKGEVL